MAHTIEGSYDVVSMSHYLEHTHGLKEELEAAHLCLKDEGLLFIEIPDPECSLGRFRGAGGCHGSSPTPTSSQYIQLTGPSVHEGIRGGGLASWRERIKRLILFATYLQVNRLAPPKACLGRLLSASCHGRMTHSLMLDARHAMDCVRLAHGPCDGGSHVEGKALQHP